MKIQSINVFEASAEQKLKFATEFLGLDIESGDSEDTIFAKIMAANNDNETIFIRVESDDAPTMAQTGSPPPMVAGTTVAAPDAVAQGGGNMQGSLGRDDPRAIIRIDTEERNGQPYNGDVSVGVNGRAWQLKRGVELPVPWRVVEALKLAIRDVVTHQDDGRGGTDEIVTQARAYPWSLVSGPSEAEIADWKQRTDNELLP